MASRAGVLARYQELVRWCDAFWAEAVKRFPKEIACREGCCSCCNLSSVNYLEAIVIARFYRRIPLQVRSSYKQTVKVMAEDACPFLCNGKCRVYSVRPIICRTHGLLLGAVSSRGTVLSSCAMNFTGVDHRIKDRLPVLDIEKTTENLAKLNTVFCMLLGDATKAAERVSLADLASGNSGVSFFGCR
ncbi:MAG: YkgJ family cysteine cluster protein [Chitinispirillaceae bacterium]|nr:YkgJ family cysteine cluster protein [Chitinispirillaceae bacterium]